MYLGDKAQSERVNNWLCVLEGVSPNGMFPLGSLSAFCSELLCSTILPAMMMLLHNQPTMDCTAETVSQTFCTRNANTDIGNKTKINELMACF